MKQLTLRGVDPELERRLREQARRKGESMNRTVLRLLRESTGVLPAKEEPIVYHDLDHLAGTWTKEEADEFDQALKEMRQVNPEEWK